MTASDTHSLLLSLSHYKLLLTEAHSQVCLCADTRTVDRLLPLIHIPAKDSRDFYSLGDIMANGQQLDGTMINILAAVKSVGNSKVPVPSSDCQIIPNPPPFFNSHVASLLSVHWWFVWPGTTVVLRRCHEVHTEAASLQFNITAFFSVSHHKNNRKSVDMCLLFRPANWNSSPLQTDAEARGWKWSSLMTRSLPSLLCGAS